MRPDRLKQIFLLTVIVSVGLIIAVQVTDSGPWVRPLLVALALCGMLVSLLPIIWRREEPGWQRLLVALWEIAFWTGFTALVLFAT
ncbi:MAG: hypothetical protein ACUVS4_00745 [Chloroflexaceae bacterium]